MWVKRQFVQKALIRRLLAVRKELPEERVLPIRGAIKSKEWLLQLLPIAGLVAGALILESSANWQLRFPLMIAGVLLFAWAVASIRKLLWIVRIRGGFAMVTPRFFVVIDPSGIRSEPVWTFERCSADRAEGGDLELRFRFSAKTLHVPFHRSQKDKAEKFAGWLAAFCNGSKSLLEAVPLEDRLKSGDWKEWGDTDPFPEFPDKEKLGLAAGPGDEPLFERIKSRWIELAVLVVSAAALFFVVPAVIDFNAFQEAADLGTATAYREYLHASESGRYSATAKSRIVALYDREIAEYTSQRGSAVGASAFISMLQYLRDHDLYAVPLTVEGQSDVINISNPDLDIVAAEPSFTDSRNRSREQSLISEVTNTIERIFPGDILQIGARNTGSAPHILVEYTYRNQLGSLYYPVEQEDLPDTARTWYYGIEIDWWLSLYIPSQAEPLHQFYLRSEPAPIIDPDSRSAQDVYDAMAESAFEDFGDAFNAEFLEGG